MRVQLFIPIQILTFHPLSNRNMFIVTDTFFVLWLLVANKTDLCSGFKVSISYKTEKKKQITLLPFDIILIAWAYMFGLSKHLKIYPVHMYPHVVTEHGSGFFFWDEPVSDQPGTHPWSAQLLLIPKNCWAGNLVTD